MIGPFDWQGVLAVMVLMIGPIKILGPFTRLIAGADPAFKRRVATRAFLYSVAALAVAVSLGRRMLAKFDVPLPVLTLTCGTILFLVALRAVLRQYAPRPPAKQVEPPTMAVAFSPLAFPTIITPYGIAAIIILVALAPDTQSEAGVLGLALLVLIVDWLVMLFADIVAGWLAPVLLLVGVVLSVTQVALGLTAILHSLHSMAVITLHLP